MLNTTRLGLVLAWLTLQETFPDFLDLIYFVKQVVALCGLWDVVIHSIIGVTWGIIPLTGGFGLIW